MQLPILLVGFITVILIVRYQMYRAGRNFGDGFKNLEEAERKANSSRRKPIPDELFYKPDLAMLPFGKKTTTDEGGGGEGDEREGDGDGGAARTESVKSPYEERDGRLMPALVEELEAAVLKQSEKTMIKFVGTMTNSEIKTRFGLANLECITEYEENFESWLHLLNDLAGAYADAGRPERAEATLRVCVDAGSDISRSYTMLADIYAERGDHDNLLALNDRVYEVHMPPVVQNKILAHIRNKFGAERDE